jgi:tetratricopeptide (TPR) repeat protein
VLNTFCQTFPHALIWYSEGNCFLVGSNQPIELDPTGIDRKLSDPNLPYDGLRKFGITGAKSIIGQLIVAEDAIHNLSNQGEKLPVNSLEKPIIEFYDLEDYQIPGLQRMKENLDFLISIRGEGRVEGMISQMPEFVRNSHEAEGEYLKGQRLFLANATHGEVDRHFKKALELDPDNPHLRHHISGHYLEAGISLMKGEDWRLAEFFISRAIEIWPHDAESRYRMGMIHMRQGRGRAALQEHEASLKLNPKRYHLRHSLADTYLINGMTSLVGRHYRILVEDRPQDPIALRGLGETLIQEGKIKEALSYCKKAYELEPDDSKTIDSYAWVLYKNGQVKQAREIVKDGGNYYIGSDSDPKQTRRIRREEILRN